MKPACLLYSQMYLLIRGKRLSCRVVGKRLGLLVKKLAADPLQRSAAQFVGGYACTAGFGSPRFSTLESLISFLGQTVAHRPQLSHLV